MTEARERTTVDIHNIRVIRAMLASRGVTLKDYLNELIRRDAVNWPDHFSVPYYKNPG